MLPNQTLHNFRVSKSFYRPILCSSETSTETFWGSKIVKCAVGWIKILFHTWRDCGLIWVGWAPPVDQVPDGAARLDGPVHDVGQVGGVRQVHRVQAVLTVAAGQDQAEKYQARIVMHFQICYRSISVALVIFSPFNLLRFVSSRARDLNWSKCFCSEQF